MEDSGDTFDEELPVCAMTTLGEALAANTFNTSKRRVRASAESFQIDDAIKIPRARITNAFMRVWNKKYRVIVDAKSIGRVRIETRTRQESERLLQVLGFGITDKKSAFRVLPAFHLVPSRTIFFSVAVLLTVCVGVKNIDLQSASLIGLLATLAVLLGRAFNRNVVVGRDGITVSSLFRKRFIPYREIAKTNLFVDKANPRNRNQVIYSGVTLRFHSGRVLLLPTTRGQQPDDEQLGLLERIDSSLDAWRAAQPIDDALLRRSERSTEDWIRALRSLGEADRTTYRVASVDREALFEIVEDPANQAVSRVAAAIAIGARLDEESRARLQKSAGTVADPKLRVAIEHVIDEKAEADLHAVLDDLDPVEK